MPLLTTLLQCSERSIEQSRTGSTSPNDCSNDKNCEEYLWQDNVAQPFFMQLVLQQIATQVVHKIANCDLKLLLHSTLREFSAGALVYSRPFPLRQSHTKV